MNGCLAQQVNPRAEPVTHMRALSPMVIGFQRCDWERRNVYVQYENDDQDCAWDRLATPRDIRGHPTISTRDCSDGSVVVGAGMPAWNAFHDARKQYSKQKTRFAKQSGF